MQEIYNTLVTQPMLQRRPNSTELRLMGLLLHTKFFVDSQNISEKLLHRSPSVMILKKVGFFKIFSNDFFFQN